MDNKFNGMTVNERLYVSGLMDEFDKCIERYDVKGAQKILEQVEIVDETSVQSIFEALGLVKE